MTAQYTEQDRAKDLFLTRRVRRHILKRTFLDKVLPQATSLEKLDEVNQATVQTCRTVLFPLHFHHAAKGVQLARPRKGFRWVRVFTRWVNVFKLANRLHPVQYLSVPLRRGCGNCRS